MADTVAPANIEARIQGEVSGQLIVGNHNVQILAEHGALVNLIGSEQLPVPRPRATPVLTLRPRRFQGLVDRQEEIKSVISGLADGPVEIYGGPGIGKTSVLRHLAYHPEVERFQAGAVYRSARREPPADLLQFLFDAFYETDLPFKPSDTQVRQYLQEKHALVLLDDVELAREEIEALTNAVPACDFIMASTERRLWGDAQSIAVKGLPAEDAPALVEREMGRPLTAEEIDAAHALCAALEGNPLRILQEVAAARDERRSLIPLAQQTEAAQRSKERLEQSLDALPESERAVLATLAAFAGASVHVKHLTALCALPDSTAVIRRLLQRNLIEAEDSRYRLTGNLAGLLERAWDLTPEKERALTYFAAWAEQHQQSPDELIKEDACIQSLLCWADQTGRWSEVQRLGRAIEGALTLSGRWGSWKSVLQFVLRASRALGDKAGEGWALHQLGTRALCLSDAATAKAHLTQALGIRESLDDHAGAAVTRHNLNLLPIAPQEPPTESDSPVSVGGVATRIPLVLKIVGSALLIGAAGLGLRQILTSNAIGRPTALAAAAAPAQINLSWTDNSDNETEFRIERKTGEGTFSQIARVTAGSTTFNDTNLDANTNYVYRVRAASADGESEYSNEPSVLTLPAAPSDLSVNDVSPTTLELRWTDKSPTTPGFKIERSTDGGATYDSIATVTNGRTGYSDSGITGATYYYRVRATNASGDSGYSNIALWSASLELPGTPRLIKAEPTSGRQTIIRWTDISSNETGFKIERKMGRGAFSQIALVEANAVAYEDRGVTADASYSYRIRATNAVGDSSYSNVVSVTTPPELPAAPTALAATLDGRTVRLSWGDNSDNETGFRIERRSGRDTGPRLKIIPAGTVRFTDSGLIPDTRYTYRVQAFNRAGSSAFSNEATIPTAPAPGTIRVSSRQISFGVVPVGSTASQEVTIANVGPGLLTGGLASPGAPFRVVSGQQNFTLSQRQTMVIRVQFEPLAAGRFRDNLVINTNDLRQREVRVVLLGVGRERPAVARLLSLDLSTSSAVGAEQVGGRLTLSSGAPEGGALVTLSSDTRAVRIPTTLRVNAGDTSTSFVIRTIEVRARTRAAVTASFGGDSRTAMLVLEPGRPPEPDVALASLGLSRNRVKGGESLEGTVTLSGRAPSGGIAIILASGSRVVSLPASVIVNTGDISARFVIKTNRVRSRTRAEIVASLGPGRRTAALELEPEDRETQPQVGLASLDLSRNRVKGGESLEGTLTLSGRAPSGGIAIVLTSSSRVVNPPASVIVNTGDISARFVIKTNRVRSRTRAEIVASLGPERRTAALELGPEDREEQPQVSLASLGLSQNRVKGGESLAGTITLSGRAPQVVAVNLSSTNPRIASVPPIIRVNAGSSVATFRIITFARPNPQGLMDAGPQIRGRPQRPVRVEITAQLFGTSRTAKLEVW